MDPAILSFRQYSSFPQQAQMPHHSQDLFLQHLAQSQQQNGQGKLKIIFKYFLVLINNNLFNRRVL